MLWLFSGEPGGIQKEQLAAAAQLAPGALWIGFDQEPPDNVILWDHWENQSWYGVAAAAARLGRPQATKDQLIISTLNGFNGVAQRPAKKEDHSAHTLRLAQAVTGQQTLPSAILIAGLSQMYERALALVGSTTPKDWVAKAVELVPAFAGSAITHLMWDFKQSGIPVIATCWEIPQGKKTVPYLPRGVTHIADKVITDYSPGQGLGTQFQEEVHGRR